MHLNSLHVSVSPRATLVPVSVFLFSCAYSRVLVFLYMLLGKLGFKILNDGAEMNMRETVRRVHAM